MTPLVVTTPEELATLVRSAVADVLEGGSAHKQERLWTRPEAAAYLRVTPRQVDLLRKRGLPTRWVASSPRFDRAELDGWTSSGGGSQRTKPRNGGKDAGSDAAGAATVTERIGTEPGARDSAHLAEGTDPAPIRPAEGLTRGDGGKAGRAGKGGSGRQRRTVARQSVGTMDEASTMAGRVGS